MKVHDPAVESWEINPTQTAVLGITLGFGTVAGIAAGGVASGFGNQAASALVALVSLAGSIGCFGNLVRSRTQAVGSHSYAGEFVPVRVPSRVYGLDVFNAHSRTA